MCVPNEQTRALIYHPENWGNLTCLNVSFQTTRIIVNKSLSRMPGWMMKHVRCVVLFLVLIAYLLYFCSEDTVKVNLED